MSAISCLVLLAMSGACGQPGTLQKEPEPIRLEARRIDRLFMHGMVNGRDGFGTRAAGSVDFYSNVDTSNQGYVFFGGGVHTAGEHLFFEKGGVNGLGNPVGPVGSGGRVGEVEFWVVASDPALADGDPVECTVSLEMFDHCVDWSPNGSTAVPNTCMPSRDDSINQVSLGRFYIDLTGQASPLNAQANGYIFNSGAAGFAWDVTDGNGFIDIRCWEYNGGGEPVTLSNAVYPAFNGLGLGQCSYPVSRYPALGYSVDNFYFDNNADARYSRNERFFFQGDPEIANLMIRLGGADGCSFDLDGNGFVNGVDIDYALELVANGCPH